LEDINGNVEVIIFPKILEQNSIIWHNDNIIALKARVNNKDGEIKLIAEEVIEAADKNKLKEFLAETLQKPARRLILTLEKNTSQQTLQRIKEVLEKHPGNLKVILQISQNSHYQTITARTKININAQLLVELKNLLGEEKVKTE